MASARPGSRGGGGGSSPRHRRRRAASLLLALPLVLLLFALAGAPARAAAVAPAKGQDADPRPAAAEGTTSAGDRGAAAGGAASTPTSTSATAPRQQQQQQQQPSSSQQSQQQAQASPRYPNPDAPALKFAVINQVQFHLEVVAGAMHVLRSLTSLDVHVYLPAKVLAANWYGFASWMRGAPGVQWRQLKEYDGRERYDLAWFLSPEYHIPYVEQVVAAMRPKVTLLYVHNAHMPEADFARLRKLSESAGVPLTTLAPHVARYIRNRTAAAGGAGGAVEPVWMLPVYPYAATRACGMQDLLDAAAPGGGPSCLKGFSVQGRIESARRDYGAVWRQIAADRGEHGRHSLASFRLNILGEAVEKFFVPRELVWFFRSSLVGGLSRPRAPRSLARPSSCPVPLAHHKHAARPLPKPSTNNTQSTTKTKHKNKTKNTKNKTKQNKTNKPACATWWRSTRTRPTPCFTTWSRTRSPSCPCSRRPSTTSPSSPRPSTRA